MQVSLQVLVHVGIIIYIFFFKERVSVTSGSILLSSGISPAITIKRQHCHAWSSILDGHGSELCTVIQTMGTMAWHHS